MIAIFLWDGLAALAGFAAGEWHGWRSCQARHNPQIEQMAAECKLILAIQEDRQEKKLKELKDRWKGLVVDLGRRVGVDLPLEVIENG